MAVTWDATAFMVFAKIGHFHKVGSSLAANTNVARVGSIAVPGKAGAAACSAKSGDFHQAGSFAAEDASVAMVNPLAAFDAVGTATSSAGRPKYTMESIAAPPALAVGGPVVGVGARGW